MWTHGMSAAATWWMWALMALATAGFCVLVALVVRMVVTRSGPGQHTGSIPSSTSVFPVDTAAQNHRSWVNPPTLPVPARAQASTERRAPQDVGRDTGASR